MATYRVLGPVEVLRDGRPAELGGLKQRAVLAVLLLDAGRVVSTDRILHAAWGDRPPPSATASLHAYISNLRRILRDDGAASRIVRREPGYLIEVAADDLDLTGFATQAGAAERAVAQRQWGEAVAGARLALAVWRGPLLVEFADEDWVRTAAAPFDELRVGCEQNLVVALLGDGQVSEAVAHSRRLIDEHPLAERPCWLHALALHRAGRSPDALDVLREHARRLDDELAIDAGPSLRDLQSAILRQDPELLTWPADATRSTTPTAAPTAAPSPTPASDLVGRERELAVLAEALAAAGSGLQWVALTGVAGIGKSRLAEEAVARFAGRVVRAGCPDDEAVPAWWPVRQLLAGVHADSDAVLRPPADVDVDTARFAIYDAVARALRDALVEGPILLVVDDVHWADPATLRLLTHLTAAAPGVLAGLVVVLTVRDGEGGPDVGRLLAALARRPGARRLALPPLRRVEVAALAASITGRALDPDEAARLTESTGGNPFFVGEYARLPADDRDGGTVPAAIRSVLGRRLAVLDADVVQVLRVAAVIGDTLDIDLLARVARVERDELADLLDQAGDEHVIVPAPGHAPELGTYAFAHALMRGEVLAGLSPIRRQRLHLRVAQAVAADHLPRRASHLVAAGPLADARCVLDACRAAAQDAEQNWYWDSAAHWWAATLDAFDRAASDADPVTDIDRDDLVVAQVAALARGGRGQTVLDVIDSALLDAVRRDRLDSAGRFASTLLRTSGAWPWAVHGSDPAPLLARLAGVESLVDDHPAAHVSVLAALAVGSCYDPDPFVPDRLSRRALDLADTVDDPDVLADALLGRALTFSGIAERAGESLELLTRLGTVEHRLAAVDEIIAHGLQSLATLTLGDVRAAAEHVHFGAVGSDLLRLANCRVQFRWADAALSQLRGDDLVAVEAKYGRALEVHKQTELYESGVFDIAMLTLRWEQGRLTRAEFAQSNPRTMPWAAAVCAAAEGAPDAEALLRAELDRVEPPSWITHGRLTMLAHAVADVRARQHAAALIERLTPFASCLANFGQVGIVGPIALALARLHALLDDRERAHVLLSVALDVARRAQADGAILRCRLLAAELALDADPAPDTGGELQAVAAEAQRRGMTGVARDATALLPSAIGSMATKSG